MSASAVVILGGDGPDGPLNAYIVDAATGEVRFLTEDALKKDPAAAVVLVLSGAEVQVRRLAIPARSEAQARSAAQFMFDETLAESADHLHYAIGDAQDEAGHRLVAAIASKRLQAWLDACAALGVAPRHVYADVSIWPVPASSVDVVERGALSMVCGGAFGGYAIETPIAPGLFRKWLSLSGASPAAVRCAESVFETWRPAVGVTALSVLPANMLTEVTLARAALDAPAYAPDLLQGDFARAPERAPSWKFWRAAAAFVLLAFLVQSGALALAGYRDATAAAATLQLAERDLRAARPDVGRIVSLRAQVAALKADLERSRTHPVLAVNASLVSTLQAHPLVRLDEVRHADPGRGVTLTASTVDASTLEAFAAALKQQNAGVEVRARSPQAGRHAVEIVVQAP